MVTFAPVENVSAQYTLTTCYGTQADVVLGGSGARKDGNEPSVDRVNLDAAVIKTLERTVTSNKNILRAIPTLLQTPIEFIRLRNLRKGWDGYRADPPSEALIRQGEGFWSVLRELHLEHCPSVKAGVDSFLTFSWLDEYPSRQVEVSIYENDDGSFRCDWFSAKDGEVLMTGESDTYPDARLRTFLEETFR